MRAFLRRAGRWFSPVSLTLAGLCFLLPFVTVSCDAPGGFGRAAPGGTTTYNGVDLMVGGKPDVSPPDRVRPLPTGQDDRLWPQPTAIAVFVAIVIGVGIAVRVGNQRARRAGVAVVAIAAVTALLVNQALVEGELTARVADALTAPILVTPSGGGLPVGKRAGDFVHTGAGFIACAALLVLAGVLNALGWWRLRTRALPPAETTELNPTLIDSG
jgi:hypothetical protein